jgi:glycosyltransferase involved in cell wall biosynthesis
MKTPDSRLKISIITAVYNGGRSIAATLRSVAEQDYADIEHIVIDGASSDDTVATVRSNGGRVAQLVSEPDKGVYDAFNKGLRRATGDAIGFLNCGDTYLSRGVISRVAKELSVPGTEAVFGDLLIVSDRGASQVVRRYNSRRFRPGLMGYGLMPAHPTLFLRREVYQRVGEYDTQFPIAGDFELCLRVFKPNTVRYRHIPEPLVNMPRGGLSNRGWRSTWQSTLEMHRACALDGVRTNWAKLSLRIPLKIMEYRFQRLK